jgi:uncharacterized protein
VFESLSTISVDSLCFRLLRTFGGFMSSRRDFLKLSGTVTLLPAVSAAGSAAVVVTTALAADKAGGARQSTGIGYKIGRTLPSSAGKGAPLRKGAFEPLPYSEGDTLSLAKGFAWYSIASQGEVINSKGDRFGDCCDFTAQFSGESKDHCFLWVNHEYIISNVLHGNKVTPAAKTKDMIDLEMMQVGGSLLELRREKTGARAGQWKVVADSKKAFRIDANTNIPLVGPAGGRTVKGTMGNCGGGFTPWRTVLSGEETTQIYYGKQAGNENYGWGAHYDRPAEDYGWVVEVDIDTGTARKLTALGRFGHEGATFRRSKDGHAVIYMGDDSAGCGLYKFVSKGKITGRAEADKDLLLEGSLFVADLKGGKWVLLVPENEKLAADKAGRFKTIADILKNTREAANVAGATALNRPEDVKVHPLTGIVYFTLTNNNGAGDFHGQVVMLEEATGDAAATSFAFESYLTGGPKHGFSCPDNLTFGPDSSLWICTDISGSSMGNGVHTPFVRNSVVRVEEDAHGTAFVRHFLQAPIEAEITGPTFSLDGKTLFLSIQHPGEGSFEDGKGYTSHWPGGGDAQPKSTVIGILEKGAKFA